MNWIAHFREYLIKVVYIIASLLKFVYIWWCRVNVNGGEEEEEGGGDIKW